MTDTTTNELIEKMKQYVTFKEIQQQPRLWRETFEIIKNQEEQINNFLNMALSKDKVKIIFTGAGSSSFVGDSVVSYLKSKTNHHIEAVATTDIVSNPSLYFKPEIPTLLISFARSGNSPESIATVNLAEKIIKDIYHIFITCNPSGGLAKSVIDEKKLLLLMPEDANDQGFAMTGSFTSMVLASLLIFNMNHLEDFDKKVNSMVENGEGILSNGFNILQNIISSDFNRAIFLGSNAMKGIAQESALKVLELTKGMIMTNLDTSLGFRHGPKSVLNDKTVVFSYISNNEYTKKYEIDLLKEMNAENIDSTVVVISYEKNEEIEKLADYYIYVTDEKNVEDEMILMFNYLLYAQMFAIAKSVQLSINPDNPSPEGTVNRVVKGVNIYPYNE